MSFVEQERALFDLLFDQPLRQQFIAHGQQALSHYQLDEQERKDFSSIRTDALELDANMRRNMVLSQLTRNYPLSMCLLSALDGGLDQCQRWIDSELMRQAPEQRPVLFGQRMAQWLKAHAYSHAVLSKAAPAIQEAELSMCWTAANLKQATAQPRPAPSLANDWLKQPIRMAAYISAALLPLPYEQLKQQLCPTADAQLWRRLKQQPLEQTTLIQTLDQSQRHLMVALACLDDSSLCEPVTHHKTVTLNEGFANLFQHINGHNSVIEIMMQLSQAGASNQIARSVQAGFQELLEQGMLELC